MANIKEKIQLALRSFILPKEAKNFSQVFANGGDLNEFYANNDVKEEYSQVLAVFKAIKAIIDNVPQVEPLLLNWNTGEKTENNEIYRLIENPNTNNSFYDFIQYLVGYYVLFGEVFIRKENNTVGDMIRTNRLPSMIYVENPLNFTELIDKETREIAGWRCSKNGFMCNYNTSEIIHIKDFNPYNRYRGLSPLVPAGILTNVDYKAMLFNDAFFNNNATLGLVLTTPEILTEQNIDRLRSSLNKMHQGVKKSYKTQIFDNGLTPQTIASNHRDMDFVEQHKQNASEIASTWRVPKALMGDSEGLSYNTFAGQKKIFWTDTIAPILKKMEESITRFLIKPVFPDIYLKLDYSNVPAMNEDLNEKMDIAIKLQTLGFTRNEINEKLQLGFDKNEIWGDNYYIGFSMIPAGTEPFDMSNIEEDKAIKKDVAIKKQQKIIQFNKAFNFMHSRLESPMRKALKSYFFKQRVLVLEKLEQKSNTKQININIDWQKQDEILSKKMMPFIKSNSDAGVLFGLKYSGVILTEAQKEILGIRLQSHNFQRGQKITSINETTRQEINQAIKAGVEEGLSIVGIKDKVKEVFNQASNSRAMMVARTETTNNLNGGSMLYYDVAEVQKKRWLTADADARETHQMAEAEGAIPMNATFSNGLDFPGGNGAPEEVINCRCRIMPVINE